MDLESNKQNKSLKLSNWHTDKVRLAHKWIEEEATQKARKPLKGSVYTCDLGENVGSEQNKRRPVLIVSNSSMNANNTNVTVLPLSTTLKTKRDKKGKLVPRYRTHYFLEKNKYSFLDGKSAAKAEHLTTVSKVRLIDHLGDIDETDLARIMTRINSLF